LRVDQEQELPLLDALALLERALEQEALDARADLDDLRRLDLPEEPRRRRDRARRERLDRDLERARRRARALRARRARVAAEVERGADREHREDRDRDPPPDPMLPDAGRRRRA